MFKRGDRVEILEEYRDEGDETFEWVVVGDEEKGRVDIQPIDAVWHIKEIHTVNAEWIRPAPPEPAPKG